MNHTIGRLSKRSGVHVETIRYYEKAGLLPPPPRSKGGHRLYSEEHLRRLSFVRRGRELGFTLDEVRNLLGLVDGGYTCGEVKEAALEHLSDIRRKITDLRRMERTLAETVASCTADDAPECPIIDTLFKDAPRRPANPNAAAR